MPDARTRTPFDLDNKPARPQNKEEASPGLPSRRSPFDVDPPASRRSETESRQVLVIQIRKAKAILARTNAQKELASANLARYLRLIQKDRNLVSPEVMNSGEAELKSAEANVQISESEVAEAEERLKEFDRRRARDLAKLRLSLSYAKKALEIAQIQRDRGIISFDDVRKSEQAVQELELQLKYDFPEEKPAHEKSMDERAPRLEPIDKPKST